MAGPRSRGKTLVIKISVEEPTDFSKAPGSYHRAFVIFIYLFMYLFIYLYTYLVFSAKKFLLTTANNNLL